MSGRRRGTLGPNFRYDALTVGSARDHRVLAAGLRRSLGVLAPPISFATASLSFRSPREDMSFGIRSPSTFVAAVDRSHAHLRLDAAGHRGRQGNEEVMSMDRLRRV